MNFVALASLVRPATRLNVIRKRGMFDPEKCEVPRVSLVLERGDIACSTTQIVSGSKRPNIGCLPKTAEDASRKQEFLELAAVCEEVANEIDDRRASG